MRPQAEAALKRMMVVEHLAEREGLRATADDVDARVEKLAEQHGRTPSDLWVELERTGQMQALESEIMEEKVFEHLQHAQHGHAGLAVRGEGRRPSPTTPGRDSTEWPSIRRT